MVSLFICTLVKYRDCVLALLRRPCNFTRGGNPNGWFHWVFRLNIFSVYTPDHWCCVWIWSSLHELFIVSFSFILCGSDAKPDDDPGKVELNWHQPVLLDASINLPFLLLRSFPFCMHLRLLLLTVAPWSPHHLNSYYEYSLCLHPRVWLFLFLLILKPP